MALLLIITYQFKLEYMYGAGNDNGEVARVARDNERQIGARNASVGMFFLHQENGNILFGTLRHLLILSNALGGFFYLHLLSKISKSSYK